MLNRLRLGLLFFAVAFAASAQNAFWSTAAVPKIASVSNDSSAVTLGLPFYSSVPGSVLGLRFYKGSRNTGTHVGVLYSAVGEPLAKATFVNETATGWQTVLFPVPVHIADHTTYTVAYLAPRGGYADDQNFAWSALNSPPLHVVGSGGVFAYGASLKFPATVWNRSNYWVDVLFRQDTASAHTVGLSWVAGVTLAVTGYRIYRGTVKGGPYSAVGNVGISTAYTDSASLVSGATYYYVVTAIDAQGAESGYSNEASAVIPH